METKILGTNQIGILGILTSIVLFPNSMDPINIWKLLILILGSGLVAWRYGEIESITHKVFSKIFLFFMILFIIWILFSSILNSQSTYSLLFGMWGRNNGLIYYLSVFILVTSILTFKKKIELRSSLNGLLGLSLLFSIYAWVQYYRMDPLKTFFPSYDLGSTIALTFGNSNFASIMLAITFTVTFGIFFLPEYSRKSKAIFILPLLLHLRLVPLIDTQGKIMYAVGGGIVFTFWLKQKCTSPKLNFLWKNWILISISTSILGILGLFGQGPFSGVLEDNVRNLKDRYFHWVSAFNMMSDHILFGVGIDQFGDWHRLYRVNESIELRGTPMSGTDNAHNTYLQIGATLGLPALIIYLAFILLITWCSFIVLRRNPNNQTLRSIYFAIWIIYVFQSAISVDHIGISIWGWISGAILVRDFLSLDYEDIAQPRSNKKFNLKFMRKDLHLVTYIASLVMAISFILTLGTVSNEFTLFSKLQKAANSQNRLEFEVNTEEVLKESIKSRQPKVRISTALQLGQIGAADKALLLAQVTSNEFPRYLDAWHLVASIYESRGEFSKAMPARAKTVELDPLNTVFKDLLNKDINAEPK